MKQIGIILVLALLLAGCSSQPASPAPQTAPATAPASAPAASDVATLFPTTDWAWNNKFDDGTTDTHEWWLRDGNRAVAVNGKGAYAAWWITADGLFRRDPFGSAAAPLLRYLPPKLEATAWQQQSDDATVEFRLRPDDLCGDYPGLSGTGTPGACWLVEMLNRGRIQRLYFRVGAGPVAASLLDPAHPGESYHKQAWGVDSIMPLPADRADLLAQADKLGNYYAAPAPAVKPLTPEQFQADVTAAVKPLTQGAASLIRMSDAQGSRWTRLNSNCKYRQQSQPFPHELELCGTPGSDENAMSVRGWYTNDKGAQAPLMFREGPTASEILYRPHIEIGDDGEIRVIEQGNDPLRHVAINTYLPKQEGAAAGTLRYELPPEGLVYPPQPEQVLLALFFARLEGLNAEVPAFFADAAERERVGKVDLQIAKGLSPLDLTVGRLEQVPNPKPGEAPVKVTPAAPAPGQPIDFLFRADGCCGNFANLWGQVTFSQSGGRWQIARLEPQFSQDGLGNISPIK